MKKKIVKRGNDLQVNNCSCLNNEKLYTLLKWHNDPKRKNDNKAAKVIKMCRIREKGQQAAYGRKVDKRGQSRVD